MNWRAGTKVWTPCPYSRLELLRGSVVEGLVLRKIMVTENCAMWRQTLLLHLNVTSYVTLGGMAMACFFRFLSRPRLPWSRAQIFLSSRCSLKFEFPSFLYPVPFCRFSPAHSLSFPRDTTFSAKSSAVLGCVFCPGCSHIMHTFSVIVWHTSSHCVHFLTCYTCGMVFPMQIDSAVPYYIPRA